MSASYAKWWIVFNNSPFGVFFAYTDYDQNSVKYKLYGLLTRKRCIEDRDYISLAI